MEEAVEADKVIVMDSAKVIKEGTPKEIFKEVEMMKNRVRCTSNDGNSPLLKTTQCGNTIRYINYR